MTNTHASERTTGRDVATAPRGTFPITEEDLETFKTLLTIQQDIGADPVTKAGLTDFMVQLDKLSLEQYARTKSKVVKGWIDLLFSALIKTPTCYAKPPVRVPGLYIAHHYGMWVSRHHDVGPIRNADCRYGLFRHGIGGGSGTKYKWDPPAQPPAWKKALNAVLESWDDPAKLPASLFSLHKLDWQEDVRRIGELFDPKKWTDAAKLKAHAVSLWEAQSQFVKNLLTEASLQADDCVSLLSILSVLANSPSDDHRHSAFQIANLNTDSPEYPNDIFINQLVYYVLMEWIDPRGGYQWTHEQIKNEMQKLILAVPHHDPASELMRNTFEVQAAVLKASPSYPMFDPYNASTNFAERKTDTLFALVEAGKTLNH